VLEMRSLLHEEQRITLEKSIYRNRATVSTAQEETTGLLDVLHRVSLVGNVANEPLTSNPTTRNHKCDGRPYVHGRRSMPTKNSETKCRIRHKVSLLEMPEEVHENIVRMMEPAQRLQLLQASTFLWKRGLSLEALHAQKQLTACEQTCAGAVAKADELNSEDLALLKSVMQLARDAVRRLPIQDFQDVADATAPAPLIRLAEEGVCTVLRVEPVKVWAPDMPWDLDATSQIHIEWHFTFRKLFQQRQGARRTPADEIADLDVVDLGIEHLTAIESITKRFAQLVSADDFVVDEMTPLTHWATIILLWMRKVHQCCVAAGSSLASTHAVKAVNKGRRRLDHWRKRVRDHAQYQEKKEQEDIFSRVAKEQALQMAQLSHRSVALHPNLTSAADRILGTDMNRNKYHNPQDHGLSEMITTLEKNRWQEEILSKRLGSKLPSGSVATKPAPLRERNSQAAELKDFLTTPQFEFMLPG